MMGPIAPQVQHFRQLSGVNRRLADVAARTVIDPLRS